MGYNICTNYCEIVSGSNIPTSKAYTEAAKSIENNTPKGMAQLKKFITSMETIAADDKVKDSRISSTKGNIKNFKGYENIKVAIDFLEKGLGSVDIVKDLSSIFNALEKYQALYTDGYSKNVRLIILEYESALYQLVTGLSLAMATELDVVQNGTSIQVKKKSGYTHGVIHKTSKDLAKQLSSNNHKDYLETLLKVSEESPITPVTESTTFLEGAIVDTLSALDTIWKHTKNAGKFGIRIVKAVKSTLFGIIPIIRGIIYLRYKKKADTILELDQQVLFIQNNIETLENKKTMDPAKKAEIIKKQKAVIEAYKKKAEKLRAELTETEKEAAIEIKKDDESIKDIDEDEFVLESALGDNLFTGGDIN